MHIRMGGGRANVEKHTEEMGAWTQQFVDTKWRRIRRLKREREREMRESGKKREFC